MSNNLSKIVRVPFSYVLPATPTTVYDVQPIAPSLFPRILAIANSYELFRVAEMKFRILSSGVAAGDYCTAGYYPGITDSPPADAQTLSENPVSTTWHEGWTVPSSWCEVPRADLRGMHEWYKTVPGSPENAEEYPGEFFSCASPNNTLRTVEFKGVFEFRGAVNTAATPMVRQKLALLKEKQRLLKILAVTENEPTGPQAKILPFCASTRLPACKPSAPPATG